MDAYFFCISLVIAVKAISRYFGPYNQPFLCYTSKVFDGTYQLSMLYLAWTTERFLLVEGPSGMLICTEPFECETDSYVVQRKP